MQGFEGKKILFIAPRFYTYHEQIIDYLKSKNAIVRFFAEDIYTPLYRFSNKLIPSLATHLKQKYINKILFDCANNSYDIIFVIRGGILSPLVMEQIKSNNPKAQYIMYQWDSNRQSNYEDIIKYFDIVKTFDKEDALTYSLDYLPLFYTKQYGEISKKHEKKLYDIVFYGAYHSDRLDIIKKIEGFCYDSNLKFKHHLYITKMAFFRLLLSRKIQFKDIKNFKTHSVSSQEILETYKHSFAVLDIELNIQSGITMRTFEAIGAGLKLITTNTNITDEPFYNENNIRIIDRYNVALDLEFFKNEFYHDELIDKYSFENWFKELFIKKSLII